MQKDGSRIKNEAPECDWDFTKHYELNTFVFSAVEHEAPIRYFHPLSEESNNYCADIKDPSVGAELSNGKIEQPGWDE